MKEAILLTDGYKLDHRRQYPENTEYVYSNWTPRSCHYYPEATEGAVVFGIQYFIKAKHIEELHDLGYLPIRIEIIPAIAGLEEYYNADADKELIAATIPDAEHSVMCAGGKEDELETFRRLITEIYLTGFVSIVSDTWDFWKVMTEYLPKLKDEILARDGRLVIRPDSGDPVHIIAGYQYKSRDSLGFAMKATWCQVNGDRYIAEDQVTKEQEDKSCLQTVFEDGKLVKEWSLRQIRDNVNNSIVLED